MSGKTEDLHNLKAMPSHEQERVSQVLALFSEVDEEISAFQKKSSLHCAEGCGRCCENPEIETTVLDVLPLAYALWQEGLAEDTLHKISGSDKMKIHDLGIEPCVFYKPDALVAGNGRCSVYLWRPLLCRLFGFSVKNDKQGKASLVTCPTMKKLCEREYQNVSQGLENGMNAPRMRDFAMQALSIDPYLGQEQLPINRAVKLALERVGNYLKNTKGG